MERAALIQRAEQFVRTLKQAETEPDERIFDSETGAFTPGDLAHPQRFHTRVTIRKRLAEIAVRLDAETGELVGWLIPDRYRGATETTLDKAAALQLAKRLVDIPEDAALEELIQEQEPDSHITNILWRHVFNGLEVENDCIAVQINSTTQEVTTMTRIWNTVTDQVDRIGPRGAEDLARRAVPTYTKAKKVEVEVVEQKFIPVVDEATPGKQTVRFVKVWAVALIEPAPYFAKITTLNIDCLTGEIVRVEHSK